MGLADDLRITRRINRLQCSVGSLLESLPDADAAALADALAGDATAAQISRVLQGHGHDIAGNTLARHRRGDCAC
jgi:hypothetical protein